MHIVNIHELHVMESRQRREFKPETIVELANSISSVGLIHPLVVRSEEGKMVLVAGERRLRALQYVWNFGQSVRCGEATFPEGDIPCVYQGELDPLTAYEMELEENIRREDLSWQERAQATSQLYELRKLQREKAGESANPAEIIHEISEEVYGNPDGGTYTNTREALIVSRHLDDPDVAKAKSARDAFKILKRKEELKRSADLGESVGRTFTSAIHQLLRGNCLDVLQTIPPGEVDVILTDPPYGIDADQFGDSGGKTPGSHFYKDDFETWSALMKVFAHEAFRVAKAQSHAYIFGDVDNFVFLKSYMSAAGWNCFRTPFIWVNPTAMRTPWVDMGPQRKYQIVLYAVKGNRPVTRIYSDVITYPSDENLNHPAQKPVALYQDLLRRSVRPGDTVLDPFCGSGPIFPAAHSFKCRAIGIEQDAAAYGISVARIQALT